MRAHHNQDLFLQGGGYKLISKSVGKRPKQGTWEKGQKKLGRSDHQYQGGGKKAYKQVGGGKKA